MLWQTSNLLKFQVLLLAQKSWKQVITANAQATIDGSRHSESLSPNQIDINRQASIAGRSHNFPLLLSKGDDRYYLALTNQKLGIWDKNGAIFSELVSSGTTAIKRHADERANATPDAKLQHSRQDIAMPHYIAGLGYEGLGDRNKAREEFTSALLASPDFLNAKIALDRLRH